MNDEWLVVSAYPGAGSPVHVINLTNLDSGIMLPVPGNDDFPQGVSINEKGFFMFEIGFFITVFLILSYSLNLQS